LLRKKKKARKKVVREKLAEKVVPQQVKDTQANAEGETSRRVELMQDKLKQVNEMNVFPFFVDPNSYSKTVENLFHLSFLIKEGRAGLELTSGVPTVKVAAPPDDADYTSGLARKQCILKLDYQTYQDAIKKWGIKQTVQDVAKPVEVPISGTSSGSKRKKGSEETSSRKRAREK